MKKIITIVFMLFTMACFHNYATSVLVAGAESNTNIQDVVAKLSATGLFTKVDIYSTQDSTPTLAFLLDYDAVLYWTDYTPLSNTDLGTVIKDYIDAGGGFVDAVFETGNYSPLAGAYTDAYMVVVPDDYEYTSGYLATRDIPNHPILAGVDTFYTEEYRATTNTLQAGAYAIASYSDRWLIAAREGVGASKVRRASLNFFPPSSDANNSSWSSNTDGDIIMANALIWVANAEISGEQKAIIGIPDTISFNKLENDTILNWYKKSISGDWEVIAEEDSVIIENYSTPDTLYYKVDYRRDLETDTTSVFEVIAKYAQTISFPNLPERALDQENYDPGATASSELMVTYSSSDTNIATIIDGEIHTKMVDTCIIFANQEGNNNYWPATEVFDTLIIKAASQIITFNALPQKTYGNADFDAGATTSSGLEIFYSSSDTNIASIVDGNVHIKTAGTCTIYADQPGNDTLIAIEPIGQILEIAKAIATVTISDISHEYDGSSKSVTTTTNPLGLDVVVTYDGSETPPSAVGTYTAIATIQELNYEGADTATFEIIAIINVSNVSVDMMKVFPNPVINTLQIEAAYDMIRNVIVYSITGEKVFEQSYSAQAAQVDFTQFNSGVYLIRIKTNNGERYERIIK
jgi:hypothetical protein